MTYACTWTHCRRSTDSRIIMPCCDAIVALCRQHRRDFTEIRVPWRCPKCGIPVVVMGA